MSAFDLRAAVLEFHTTYGHPVRESPTLEIPDAELQLGLELIAEELGELTHALAAHDLLEATDALGDLLWVVESMAVRCGINTTRVLREIDASNKTKLGLDNRPLYKSNGKVAKGPNFVPPNIERALDPEFSYPEDREVDPSLDVILAPSGGVAAQYIAVEYPQLAQLKVVTPLSVSRLVRYPVRDCYVMRGIMVGFDWPEIQASIEEAQRPYGGQLFALDC